MVNFGAKLWGRNDSNLKGANSKKNAGSKHFWRIAALAGADPGRQRSTGLAAAAASSGPETDKSYSHDAIIKDLQDPTTCTNLHQTFTTFRAARNPELLPNGGLNSPALGLAPLLSSEPSWPTRSQPCRAPLPPLPITTLTIESLPNLSLYLPLPIPSPKDAGSACVLVSSRTRRRRTRRAGHTDKSHAAALMWNVRLAS